MLEKAIILAARADAGQVDKGGEPYILHPLRVMLAQESEVARICAVLHDVLEDTPVTREDLLREGFSLEIVTALEALSKRPGENYELFIDRILGNELACRVKAADIRDNMNLDRLAEITARDLERVKRYEMSLEKITASLGWQGEG